MASVTDTAFAADEPLAAYHLGAGGLTLPRYLSATRPGTTSDVSEIDAGVVAADVRLLGGSLPDGVEVDVEDGRLAIDDLAPDSLDLIVGDAFGGVSVPWHLATVEAVGGLEERWPRTGSTSPTSSTSVRSSSPGRPSRRPPTSSTTWRCSPSPPRWRATTAATWSWSPPTRSSTSPRWSRGWASATSRGTRWRAPALDAWVGDAPVLTDDYAPVDQLLTPYAR